MVICIMQTLVCLGIAFKVYTRVILLLNGLFVQEVERLEKNRIVAQERAAKALEEKKKRRNQVRKEQKEEAEKLRHQAEKEAEDLDLLPDDVLAALAEREASDHRLVERRVVTEQLRNVSSSSKRKKKFVDQRDIAGFTVQISKTEPYRKPSGELAYMTF